MINHLADLSMIDEISPKIAKIGGGIHYLSLLMQPFGCLEPPERVRRERERVKKEEREEDILYNFLPFFLRFFHGILFSC